jgi:hypothetical protein
MGDDHERRISTNEADIKNIGGVVIELKDWMKKSSDDRRKNHEDVIGRLSVIETKQNAFMAYQESCDEDRKILTDRVTEVEKSQSWNSGKASIISAILGALGGALVAILAALIGKTHA